MDKTNHLSVHVRPTDSVRQAIQVIDVGRLQIALVTDDSGHLLGTVTDGDIRRGMLRGVDLDDSTDKVMNVNPVTLPMGASRAQLMALMSSRSIKHIPLLDHQHRVVGLQLMDNLLQSPKVYDNPVIILAGGQGSRLRPLTNDIPKPLLKVGGNPVLDLILHQLYEHGFRKVFVSVNYLGDRIENHLGDGSRFGVSLQYIHETEPLGTAGPLSLVPIHDMPCVVVNGDLLTKINFQQMLQFHADGKYQATIGVTTYSFQVPYGVIITDQERVVGFHEKPDETRLVNAGVYVLDPKVVAMVPARTQYDMNQLLQFIIDSPNSHVGAFPIHEYWMDIGTADDYRQSQSDFKTYFS